MSAGDSQGSAFPLTGGYDVDLSNGPVGVWARPLSSEGWGFTCNLKGFWGVLPDACSECSLAGTAPGRRNQPAILA